MKHQQVVVDYWSMVKTSCTCLLLALSGYILIKMVQTIFWLPGYLQNNQKRLEELAAQYAVDLNEEDNDSKECIEEKQAELTTEKNDGEIDKKEIEVVDAEAKKDK